VPFMRPFRTTPPRIFKHTLFQIPIIFFYVPYVFQSHLPYR
jgi:hypothetical protein